MRGPGSQSIPTFARGARYVRSQVPSITDDSQGQPITDDDLPKVTSLAELQASVAELDSRIAKLVKRRRILAAAADEMFAADGLPEARKKDTVLGMNSVSGSDQVASPGRRASAKHPFPLAVRRKMTLAAWAKVNGYSYDVMRQWYAAKNPKNRNKIPRRVAIAIEREFGLPANETTWPQGIAG